MNCILRQMTTKSIPTPGEGATIIHHSDRSACTITEVSANGKRVVVQQDIARRVDKNGMSESQQYEYSPNPEGGKNAFTLRKNGQWIMEGKPMKNGTPLHIGYRDEFYDFSF